MERYRVRVKEINTVDIYGMANSVREAGAIALQGGGDVKIVPHGVPVLRVTGIVLDDIPMKVWRALKKKVAKEAVT